MPRYAVTALVTVEAATPGAAVSRLHKALAASLPPDLHIGQSAAPAIVIDRMTADRVARRGLR